MKFFLLLLLVVSILLIFYSVSGKRESYSALPRILHLVLYSPGNGYDEMYQATREYYKNAYYYSYDETLEKDYQITGDRLLLKGKETYLPGILEKTLKAFSVFPLDEYDYVLRSNISTVVNVDKLKEELRERPLDYGGGYIHRLQWIDPGNGIVDKKYWGTSYASGTAIILSTKVVKDLLTKTVDKSVIDDVAIGVALKGYSPKCFLSHFTSVEKKSADTSKWFFRHRTNDRLKDAENMKWLLKTLTPSSL